MSNVAVVIGIVIGILILIGVSIWIGWGLRSEPNWLKSAFKRLESELIESFFRNKGMPYRNLIGLLLGYTAAILLLSSNTISNVFAAWTFVISLMVTMLLLVVVRPYKEREVDRFAWGLLVIIILGFGLGALIHQYRSWPRWLWDQYRRINEYPELLLEALFLLGVILGFFVVRNWAKEQKEFISSLSAVLGGAFIATILGDMQDELGAMQAFAYYALGFTLSGAINLIAAARLTANYTNKRSITSRAMLDFLYGSERAKLIDGYFLKNFEEDPDYARRWLTDTLMEYRRLVGSEFAKKMEARRIDRKKRVEDETKKLKAKRNELEPECSKLIASQKELEKLQGELEQLKNDDERKSKQEEIDALEELIKEQNTKCDEAQMKEYLWLKQRLEQLKHFHYYELLAIECDEKNPGKDREYKVIYKQISSDQTDAIHEGMFRVGIAIRWQDTMEYITAPGQYRTSFPLYSSVAGLALLMRQTIVMDRDKNKRFRTKDNRDGICPNQLEQSRGTDEIDFLSYISIPIVSRLSTPTENGIGIVNIDTKLFVTREALNGKPVEASEGIFSAQLALEKLTEYASGLYEEDDKCIKYLEELTAIIVPVTELYSKCRIGAI